MLAEGRRRAENGEHVVIGWVERHGRSETKAQRGDLELVPARTVEYRGSTFRDMDVEAVLATGADLVLVDELAHWVPDTQALALGGGGGPARQRVRRPHDGEHRQPVVCARVRGTDNRGWRRRVRAR